MLNSRAHIILENRDALRVAASAARISTQQGTAMEIFAGSLGDARDLKLIDKVLSSGHKSVIEHQVFSLAFNNVSVLVEQFVIEARLASFTVKSRRYVDFAGAGFVVPDALTDDQRAAYEAVMKRRFSDYEALMALGIPKEDARFVLPYCLRSNFYMTLNARELIALIGAMLWGRGKGFAEIEALGGQLKAQFDGLYPGVLDKEARRFANYAAPELPGSFLAPSEGAGDAALVSAPVDAQALLSAAMAFSGRLPADHGEILTDANVRALITDARPRELELLNYAFRVSNISLACLTHFTRHRMDSPLIPPVLNALAGGRYVLPESVRSTPGAENVYRSAFEDQYEAARRLSAAGVSRENLSYLAMSGHELDILLGMNARQLLHFMKLRVCSRAQWEIRGVATKMLELLAARSPEIFSDFGPSCLMGPCPEGRMSCGHPWTRSDAR